MSQLFDRFTGMFDLLNEAESQVNANRVDRPAANLAASLAWSMAGRYVFLETDLRIMDDPANPNRPRSADASAARTQSIEQQIEDTLFILSYVSGIASKQMLPDPEVIVDGRSSPRPEGQAGMSAEQWAELTGQSPQQVKDAWEYDDERRAKVEALRAAVLQDDTTRRWAVNRLKDAMGTALPCPFEDLHPFMAASLFGKMSEKLQMYVINANARARRIIIPRQAQALAAQIRIMTSIAVKAYDEMVAAQMQGETSNFEPERAALPVQGGTDADDE